jgi:hypothetical protein
MTSQHFHASSIDYASLITGEPVSQRSYLLNEESVNKYKEAVQDRSFSDQRKLCDTQADYAPPMSIAALSLKGVINDLKIPGGTLHTGQEIQFLTPVPIGETLKCTAVLKSNTVRSQWRFLVVTLMVENKDGSTVMRGKSTIMVPV